MVAFEVAAIWTAKMARLRKSRGVDIVMDVFDTSNT